MAQLVKNLPARWVDLGSIPGLGRSPGERKGYPLQYPGLENSMDYIVLGVIKTWTRVTFTFMNIQFITLLNIIYYVILCIYIIHYMLYYTFYAIWHTLLSI